jgi:hypothetical protein
LLIKTPLVGHVQPLGERAPVTTVVLTGVVVELLVGGGVVAETAPTGLEITVVLSDPEGELELLVVVWGTLTGAVATAVEGELERPSKRIVCPT